MNKELSAEQRRNSILDILSQEGKVKVNKLSELFNISEVTIRNDLTELESKGLLERNHGGAVSTAKAYYNMSFMDRMNTNKDEKLRIAKAAASLVNNGDSLIINSGTTTLYTAKELRNTKNLIVLTNSLSIAKEMGHFRNLQLILLGGNLNVEYQFTYGDDTINGLRKYKVDKFIISIDGINVEEGITTFLHLESEINRQMISRVNKVIAVADHSKIDRVSFAHISTIDCIDTLITDDKADKEQLELLKEKGLDIIVV